MSFLVENNQLPACSYFLGGLAFLEASFNPSCFHNGEEIVPPKELPKLPYKIFMDHDEEYDDFSILIQWSFVTNECPAEPPRQ